MRTITWTRNLGVGGTVNIDFSQDNGATWSPVALGVTSARATKESYTGPMPATMMTQGLIRVSPTIDPTRPFPIRPSNVIWDFGT